MENDSFEVEGFALIGRTFTEYVHMFDLDPATLTGRSILDCPSGVGEFVRTAHERDIPATGADVVYGKPSEYLERRCEEDYERVAAQLPEKKELFEWGFYGSIERRCRLLKRAYEAFLDDYTEHPGRYVPAVLPELPFASNSFSLVLCAHFLFLYGDRLDYEFSSRVAPGIGSGRGQRSEGVSARRTRYTVV